MIIQYNYKKNISIIIYSRERLFRGVDRGWVGECFTDHGFAPIGKKKKKKYGGGAVETQINRSCKVTKVTIYSNNSSQKKTKGSKKAPCMTEGKLINYLEK